MTYRGTLEPFHDFLLRACESIICVFLEVTINTDSDTVEQIDEFERIVDEMKNLSQKKMLLSYYFPTLYL